MAQIFIYMDFVWSGLIWCGSTQRIELDLYLDLDLDLLFY